MHGKFVIQSSVSGLQILNRLLTGVHCGLIWSQNTLHNYRQFHPTIVVTCKSHRPRRRSSTAAHLLRSWVRIPPGAWMSVCCVCCVLSGRGLWDGLITRPEESYRLWRVVVCDHETSWTRRPQPALGCRATENNNNNNNLLPQHF
jgi:hypothetical protein